MKEIIEDYDLKVGDSISITSGKYSAAGVYYIIYDDGDDIPKISLSPSASMGARGCFYFCLDGTEGNWHKENPTPVKSTVASRKKLVKDARDAAKVLRAAMEAANAAGIDISAAVDHTEAVVKATYDAPQEVL